MGKYSLVAFDMDGTLLNSKKEISEKTKEAIAKASAAGKVVALSTGRCLPELTYLLDQIPSVRYLIFVSGALVYDVKEDVMIYDNALSDELVEEIYRLVKHKDIMFHILGMDSYVKKEHVDHMADYKMEIYQGMFYNVATLVDDVYEEYKKNHLKVAKFNLYHRSIEDRNDSLELIKHLNIELVFAEASSLECTAVGVTKGKGLLELCKYLNIPIEESIAVGDADNDLDILKTAGLAVGMGNANENVRAVSDVFVADNDHDGCAEVIEKYLLG